MSFPQYAAITIVCLLVGALVKASKLANKWIPIICGAVGGLLGIAAVATGIADFPASDWLNGLAVGIFSGLAATGGYEAVHQLIKAGKAKKQSEAAK